MYLIVLLDLPTDAQRVIKFRFSSDSVKTICTHHFSMYYESYETLQFAKNCCDPLNILKRVIRGVKKIDLGLNGRVF